MTSVLRTTTYLAETLVTKAQTDYGSLRTTMFQSEVLVTKAQAYPPSIRTTMFQSEVLVTTAWRENLTFDVSVVEVLRFREGFNAGSIFVETGGGGTETFTVTYSPGVKVEELGGGTEIFKNKDPSVSFTDVAQNPPFIGSATLIDRVEFTDLPTEAAEGFTTGVVFNVSYTEPSTNPPFVGKITVNDELEFGQTQPVLAYSTGVGVSSGEKRADISGTPVTFQNTVVFGGTLTIRRPEFNDVNMTGTYAELRTTLGGDPEQVDDDWPDYERFEMTFRALTQTKAEEIRDYVRTNLGLSISYTHYDGRTFNIIFIEPDLDIRDVGQEPGCQFTLTLKFETV